MDDRNDRSDFEPADSRTDEQLAALFEQVYSNYYLPVHLDAAAFRGMVRTFDLELAASRVGRRSGADAAVALLGVRGERGWIGGMGVAPAARRAGLGRAIMEAVIEQARRRALKFVQLEVLVQNLPAIRLYERLGFQATRRLEVLALTAPLAGEPAGEIPAAEARAWIAARRAAPEPWQREDASLDQLDSPATPLRGLEVKRNGVRTAAAVALVAGERASLLQGAVGGADVAGDARALCAAARAWAPTLRYLNVPETDPVAAVLRAAGGELQAAQFEMTLDLRVPSPSLPGGTPVP